MNSVLTQIARAIDRGTLSNWVRVVSDGNNVEVTAVNDWYNASIRETTVAYLLKRYPGGTHTIASHAWRTARSRRTRKETVLDLWRYSVAVGDVQLTTSYTKNHEHGAYIGTVTREGEPHWRCGWCRSPITITKARELGLLPKLAR